MPPPEGGAIVDMSPPARIRSGLVSVSFRQLPPREIVALALAGGLEGIEWGGDVHVPNGSSAREVHRMTDDAGLAVAAYGSYWRAEDEGSFETVVQIALTLGAPTIRVWAGRESSAIADASAEARMADILRSACDVAASAETTISLEYHAGTLTDSLVSTLRLVRRVDHPALRLYWQPAPERTPAMRLDELRAVLPWLSNLHVFQWTRPEAETLRHPLAEGEAEWSEILRVASGDRFALLEFVPNDDPALLPREAATLRRLIAESQ